MAQGIYDKLEETYKLLRNVNDKLCCGPQPSTTTTTSTSTTSTTTTVQLTRKFWGIQIPSAGRSMTVPNQTAFYTGNTVANISATNPDLKFTGIYSGQALGSQGVNTSRIIAPNTSSPFTTINPNYAFTAPGGFQILRSLKEYYSYIQKIINDSFLATRNAQIVIKRVTTNINIESGLLLADNLFLIGIDFDATGLERDGYIVQIRNYDFSNIPGTINTSTFTHTSQWGSSQSVSGSNVAMNIVAPSSTWINGVTSIYGVTIAEDFPIPPGW